MNNLHRSARKTSSTLGRWLWQSVGAVLVFAQVAVAADQCLPAQPPGVHDMVAGAVAEAHHGFDAHCVSELVPADQAPAAEAQRFVPDVGVPITTAHAWKATIVASAMLLTQPAAATGPPLRLQFRNLRL